MSEREQSWGGLSGRTLWAATALAFVVSFLGLALFYAHHPLLYDADAYYHLAIARATAQHGLLHDLPWARFSTMHPGFGDKEVLFHLLLVPFAALPDPLAGGRLALALFDALLAAALAHFGLRLLRWWGLLLPLWLAFSATEMTWRSVRLRPELLSLVLLLAACWAIARGRYRWLGLLAVLYTLSYTAFHAFLGLCGLLFLLFGWARRRWEWGLLLYPVLGVGLGLVVHPNFPKNLEVWIVQSIEFFRHKAALDVGSEFRPDSTDVVLLVQLGWGLALAALWRSGVPVGAGPGSAVEPVGEGAPAAAVDERSADTFTVAALVFGLLYLLMSRFAFYAFPFATLAVLFEMRRRGLRPGRSVRLLEGRRLPLAVALGLCVLVSLPEASRQLALFAQRTDPGPGATRLVDREAVGRAIPAGAKVAAPWRSTPIYMLWAPQARYLNVLDPVFMAVPFPQVYAIQRAVFEGTEPDVPLAVSAGLDSDHLAFPTTGETEALLARLAADPRVATVYRKWNGVFRIVPASNGAFLLDWKAAPAGTGEALPLAASLAQPDRAAAWTPYPRLPPQAGGSVEGYVDARRLSPTPVCMGFVHDEEVTAATRIDYELASSGPASVSLDGTLLLSAGRGDGAILGQGMAFSIDLRPGRHRIFVRACPDDESPKRTGFYLLERKREPGQ